MEIIFANFGKSIVLLSWIMCGLISIVKRDSDPLFVPFALTIGYGFFILVMKGQ